MVTALVLALIAALAPPGRAQDPQPAAAPAASQDPTPAAHELEQRVLELRARIDAAGAPDAELLLAACAAATDLLAVPQTELSALARLDERVALARRFAAALKDPDASLRVEYAFADALLGSDPRSAHQVLVRACERHSAANLLPYARESLLQLSAELGEWEWVDRLLPDCRRNIEAELARAREGLRTTEDRPEASAALGAFLDVVRREVTVLACEVEHRSRLGLLDLAFDSCRQLREIRQELTDLIPRHPGAHLAADPAFADAVLNTCVAELFAYLSGRSFIELLGVLDEVEALHLAGDPSQLRALAYARAHALSELARDGADTASAAERLYRDSLGAAALEPQAGEPATEVELDMILGLADLLLRRNELAETELLLGSCETRLRALSGQLQGLRAEVARARLVVLRSALSRARGAGREALHPLLDELLACYAALLERQTRVPLRAGGVGTLHWGQQRDLVSECVDTILTLDPSEAGKERAFDLVLQAQLLGTFARRLGLGKPGLAEVRSRMLGEREGLIVILPALERTHLFLVDRAGIRHVFLPSRGKLLALVRPFAELVGRPPSTSAGEEASRRSAFEQAGRRLSQAFLPPECADALHDWSGFYVCGLEYLESLPIEAVPGADGRPLGCTHSISWLPSVAEGLWLLEQPATRGDASKDLLLLSSAEPGDSVYRRHPELTPIQLADAEVDELARGFAPSRVDRLERQRATRAELARLAPTCRGILEIFGHGVASSLPERPAAVALSATNEDEGLLDCEWIEAHLVPPPFVALFACGTALGPTRLGDDSAAQLGNSLLFKRARAVLLSRARLSLGAMLELDQELHRALLSELRTPAEALRLARLKLWRSAEWRDPFYFGTVSLLGVGLAPLEGLRAAALEPGASPRTDAGARSSRWLWIALLAVIGTLAPVVWRRRARNSQYRS